jgi:hypothetical protein
MQYILTQEEYDKLRSQQKLAIDLNKKKLQTLCTKIANEMPVKWGWGGPDPKPWGCIIHEDDTDPENYSNFGYCDHCPVQEICPYTGKEYSK